MTQVYLNLIGNALKFNKQAEPQIEITFAVENSENIYGVRDNGIGIEEEYFQQVFLPFRRLHGQSKYEGSGIGLALCARIVERHGGRIWVESTVNNGSHFKFTLGEENGKQAG
jgi:light-regulated signal transduction histidine kinase (bacteriophytochrome)